MSPGAIENLLRSAFAPPANRGPEPLALDTFNDHLRPAAPAKPSVSEQAPPPAPAKKDAKPPASDDDSTNTDDTAAASTIAADAAAPAPVIQDEAKHDVTEEPVAEVADKGEAESKAKVKLTGKKAPPRGPEPAPVEVTQEVGQKDETAAGAETEATATGTSPTDAGAAKELVTAKLAQPTPTKKTEQPEAAEAVVDAPQNNEETAETNDVAVTVTDEVSASDNGANIEDAAIAAAQKSAATPKAETKPTAPAPRKRTPDAESPAAANNSGAEVATSDSAQPVTEAPAEEPTENNVRSPKKNSKSPAPSADERLKADTDTSESTATANNGPTGSEQKPDAAKDYASTVTAVAPDANATPDRAPPPPAPPVTPANDSAPLRRASLTLQPPTTERTASGPRLTEMEQTRFVQRVARAFEAAQQRDGEIRLRLSPPELGSLRLELKLQGGVMSARIETETEAARTVLLDQLPALRERLQEHNIRVERFDVDLADHRSGGQAHTPDQQGHQPRPEPRQPVPTRRPTLATPNDERPAPRPSGDKGRINVII